MDYIGLWNMFSFLHFSLFPIISSKLCYIILKNNDFFPKAKITIVLYVINTVLCTVAVIRIKFWLLNVRLTGEHG